MCAKGSKFSKRFKRIGIFSGRVLYRYNGGKYLRARTSKSTLRHVLLREVNDKRDSVLSGQATRGPPALSRVVATIGGRSLLYVRVIRRVNRGLKERVTKLVDVFGPRLMVVKNALSSAKSCVIRPVGATVEGCSLGLIGGSTAIAISGLGSGTKMIKTYVLTQDEVFRVWGSRYRRGKVSGRCAGGTAVVYGGVRGTDR